MKNLTLIRLILIATVFTCLLWLHDYVACVNCKDTEFLGTISTAMCACIIYAVWISVAYLHATSPKAIERR